MNVALVASFNRFNNTTYSKCKMHGCVFIHIGRMLQVKFPEDTGYIYTKTMSKFCVSVFVDCVVAVVAETAVCIS